MKKKKCFTLLEILACLLILSIVGTVLGWGIKDSISHNRFRQNVRNLERILKQLQMLAISYQTDFRIELFAQDSKVYFRSFADESLKNAHFPTKGSLEEVSFITLRQGDVAGKNITIPITKLRLDIFSSGRIEPLGMIGFHRKGNKEEDALWIDLSKPLMINFFKHLPENKVKQSFPQNPEKGEHHDENYKHSI